MAKDWIRSAVETLRLWFASAQSPNSSRAQHLALRQALGLVNVPRFLYRRAMPHIEILATMPILIRKEPGESFPEFSPQRSLDEMGEGRAHRSDRKVEHEPLLPSIRVHRFSKGECVILNRVLRLILAASAAEVTANGLKQLFPVLAGQVLADPR